MTDNSLAFFDIIQVEELRMLEDAMLFDCRAKLGDPLWGQEVFDTGHIPGAQYLNLDVDLASPPDHRGRHPLPDRDTWLDTVRTHGVTNGQQVVLYDDASGAYAARAWWMFRWLGHDRVAVLDGGIQHWPAAQLSTEAIARPPSQFEARDPLTRLIDSEAVVKSLRDLHLIDARAEARFNGEEEPIDPIAGHIPGAICLPFQGNLDEDGCFLDPTSLQNRFKDLPHDPICYCGSGVTACHNILAMHLAGLPEPQLYADSWSGWITDPDRPIEKS